MRILNLVQQRSPFNIVGAGLLIVASTYGLSRYTYGLFVPEIRESFSLSQSLVGAIGSASYMGYLLATLASPFLVRNFGPRLPILLGGVCATLGMGLIGLASSAVILAIGVTISGCSPGLAYPPMSDAVKQLCSDDQQNRYYALINSGTSFGILLSGPLALLAGPHWQFAWLLFSTIALIATLWNALIMPGSAPATNGGNGRKENVTALLRRRCKEAEVRCLFLGALTFGLVTAVYWTFSVALLESQSRSQDMDGVLFWIIVGATGVVGALAGDLVTRLGLKATLTSAVLMITLAIAILAASNGLLLFALISAVLFGATFILITALYGIWSTSCFSESPATGFGVTFFLISAGQLISPALAGSIAEIWNLVGVFYVTAAGSLLILLMLPKKDVFRM